MKKITMLIVSLVMIIFTTGCVLDDDSILRQGEKYAKIMYDAHSTGDYKKFNDHANEISDFIIDNSATENEDVQKFLLWLQIMHGATEYKDSKNFDSEEMFNEVVATLQEEYGINFK